MLFRQLVACSFFLGIACNDIAAETDLVLPEFCVRDANASKRYLSLTDDNEERFLANRQTLEDGWDHPVIQRLDVSAEMFRSRGKDSGYLRTIVPLAFASQQKKAFFFAPGVTYSQRRMMYNLGLGFRQANTQENFLWGLNIFYDYDAKGGNRRLGEGIELGVPFVSLFGNLYQSLSHWHTSKTDKTREEKTASGYDLKLKVTLPVYPQIALSTRYFSWAGKGIDLYSDKHYAKSPDGFIYSLEYQPVSMLGLALVRTIQKHGKGNNTAVMMYFSYDFGRSLSSQTTFSWKPVSRTLSSALFNQPDREFGVVVNSRQRPLAVAEKVEAFLVSEEEEKPPANENVLEEEPSVLAGTPPVLAEEPLLIVVVPEEGYVSDNLSETGSLDECLVEQYLSGSRENSTELNEALENGSDSDPSIYYRCSIKDYRGDKQHRAHKLKESELETVLMGYNKRNVRKAFNEKNQIIHPEKLVNPFAKQKNNNIVEKSKQALETLKQNKEGHVAGGGSMNLPEHEIASFEPPPPPPPPPLIRRRAGGTLGATSIPVSERHKPLPAEVRSSTDDLATALAGNAKFNKRNKAIQKESGSEGSALEDSDRDDSYGESDSVGSSVSYKPEPKSGKKKMTRAQRNIKKELREIQRRENELKESREKLERVSKNSAVTEVSEHQLPPPPPPTPPTLRGMNSEKKRVAFSALAATRKDISLGDEKMNPDKLSASLGEAIEQKKQRELQGAQSSTLAADKKNTADQGMKVFGVNISPENFARFKKATDVVAKNYDSDNDSVGGANSDEWTDGIFIPSWFKDVMSRVHQK